MTPTIAALIPAAGSGTRLGLGPKALVKVAGKSLLARSIETLAPHVDELVVALPTHLLDDSVAWQNDLISTPQRYIAGGETRQQSVLALLEACETDLVIIHDAARPFLPEAILQALIDAAQQYGAATAALPVADTLVRAEKNGHWGEVCPREGLWAVQTPQVFNRQLLFEAHKQALADGFIATDDAGVVARTGHQVHLVHGDARMFKVTTPSDLALAEALAHTSSKPNTIQSKPPTAPTRYFSPAKVNLGLSVLGIRPDHYHELHSLMVPLNIGDILEIEPAEQLHLEVKGADLPTNQENLVYRAAQHYLQAYQKATGQTHGAQIILHKHLPLASGMGGGSSNAATTLLAFNQLYPAQIDLPALALQLGADVPFFLLQQAALAEGIGEQLTPLTLPPIWLVLVNPGIEVSAGDAYQWLDATANFSKPLNLSAIIEAVQKQAPVPYWNSLQAPTLAKHPKIQEVLDTLLKAGLHSPLMSGSGSTCFAVAQSQAHAEQVASQLTQQHAYWWVRSTQTLSHLSEIQQQLRILC